MSYQSPAQRTRKLTTTPSAPKKSSAPIAIPSATTSAKSLSFTWGQACAAHGLAFCAKESPMYLTVKQTYAEENNKIENGLQPMVSIDLKDAVSPAMKASIWRDCLKSAGIAVAVKGTSEYEHVKELYIAAIETYQQTV